MDKGPGRYCYQVQACGSWGCTDSNIECVDVLWEHEDNDERGENESNGPLCSGTEYKGYPDDMRDWFRVYLNGGEQVTVRLQDHTGTDVWLSLYDLSSDSSTCSVYKPVPPSSFELPCTVGSAGWYYVRIYTGAGYNSNTAYRLLVTAQALDRARIVRRLRLPVR